MSEKSVSVQTAPSQVAHSDPDSGPSLRSWLAQLERAGQLHRINTQVDWDQEIGAISRVNVSQGGPGLLFENIKRELLTLEQMSKILPDV